MMDQIERDIDHEHRVGHFSAPSERYPEHSGEVCGNCGQFVSRGVITDSDIERLKPGFNSALLSRLIKRIDSDAAKIAELEASEPQRWSVEDLFGRMERLSNKLGQTQAYILKAVEESGLGLVPSESAEARQSVGRGAVQRGTP